MIDKIKQHIEEAKAFNEKNKESLEQFRIKYLGSKGLLKELFNEFKNIPNDQKKDFGQVINTLKAVAEEKVKQIQEELESKEESKGVFGDLTRAAEPVIIGSRHPISIVKNQIIDIFANIGFNVSEGPEIEDDWHNFTALNLPEYHPARDMQDTFFIQTNPDVLLRTHTSSVQVRYMENHKPPIRTISPGRVFRNEAISSRSHCIFHQVEGLYIDKDVSFADLKQTLLYFTKEMFGKSKIRLRPSYFPFTEPSAEIDIYWGLKTETDYRITKGTGWLEIGGCGMVDPNVLKNCDINPDEYNGFAFGMGVERIAMLLYQIGDIRMFYENDVRFLEQFKANI
ncbi:MULTISPECIES: phenylalanine--tRNA ligase subunit alpha [Flavobacterium]|jgi:phenylalanyl-tRNA synthetase alpha chain|uniref:Phenylalanine--tRNA ligase alpha subunit n=2 Tax=Flavobacterium johnsoniae TaxID=986 RepID=SYFA_FLAJ1|nr:MULTISPECIES: phenylalanine--tRNA ligase subunit alpha [Flavobacterium]A5FLW1.1 RecName: Full=Phenylalanine--tRNA ligase alpha subunit; AltName: Full=Phenylalanyl-tRNA synthetase alpha subunit; Short=PheRS [Flavobacterium johnsoniae UW101]HEU0126666.1 phenylalanine--tRNA ligase subunit alpha [Flavobacterium sp.]ABQ03802.1 phenylalanyl-tRNA synthetase, alpha subunit [Flavobacterium johnsoniae UW101]OXG03324.1 phenylalanine--tRNA ligase subunit alpha [Flavobacterium johnsoniae UW101]WDF59521.